MKLIVKIGLETDGDYSLLHEDRFGMKYDGIESGLLEYLDTIRK